MLARRQAKQFQRDLDAVCDRIENKCQQKQQAIALTL
jgi:hypothetical protein